MTRVTHMKLIRVGSAKRLTRSSDLGTMLEALDPSDRWMFGG